jgi:hypothetical protein
LGTGKKRYERKSVAKWTEEIPNLTFKKSTLLEFTLLCTPENRTDYMRRRATVKERCKKNKQK